MPSSLTFNTLSSTTAFATSINFCTSLISSDDSKPVITSLSVPSSSSASFTSGTTNCCNALGNNSNINFESTTTSSKSTTYSYVSSLLRIISKS